MWDNEVMKRSIIWFSKDGYEALFAKLDDLRKKREEILPRLQMAREQGDLSENGAYKAARFELSDTDRQIRQVERLIKFGKIAVPRTDGIAGFGNKITLVKRDGTQVIYQLVSTYEADPLNGKISANSPVGAEIIGKRVGEYAREMEIIKIV